jgi:hypothetical protein
MELLDGLSKIIVSQGSEDFYGRFALTGPDQSPQRFESHLAARVCAYESQSNFNPSLVHRQLGHKLDPVLLAPLRYGLLPILS